MNAEEVAQALGRAARAGEQWKALCPAHADRNPSLTLRDAPGGRLLYKCHAGCSQVEVQDALHARGLLSNGDGREVRGPFCMTRLGEPVTVYDYRDRTGRVVFHVARYQDAQGKKEYRPWVPDGAGRFKCRAAPAPRPLYRLPELLAAENLPVLAVEGEKCADAAARLLGGTYAVTTWSGGVAGVKDADLTPLAGRRVVVWPDSDAPGRAAARKLAGLLARGAGTVGVLSVGDDRPAGWDVADAAAEGWSASDLETFIEEHAEANTANVGGSTDGGVVFRRMSDVAARPVRWLWQGKIARGKITIIAGNPGLGKSQIVASLAAIVSTGGRFPLTDVQVTSGNVILLNAEDAADDTIRPRLEVAGADLSRVIELQAVREGYSSNGQPLERGFRLDLDLPALREVLARLGSVDLIAIDPITAYLGEVDAHKNADVRAALAQLSGLAQECGAAVVLVSHLNKNMAAGVDALQRVSSSIGFTAAPRAAWLVARDQDNPKRRRLFLPMKNNLAEDESGLAFTIEPGSVASPAGEIATSCVLWEAQPCTISADEAVRGPLADAERTEVDEAMQFLRDLLADGPVLTNTVNREANGAGFSAATIRRARAELRVEAQREGMMGGGGIWRMALPK